MLYKKSKEKTLTPELFKNPTSEYRGTPFWAWNCKLNKEILTRQIEYLKEMGFGGFHMHSRSGMATEYLSDDFFDLIKTCVDKAKQEDMLAYLYDEDRWPSGAVGGLLTKEKKYRQRYLLITRNTEKSCADMQTAYETGETYRIASFKVELNDDGTLKNYVKAEESANVWNVYFKTSDDDPWYNDQAYADTLNGEAIEKFIELTYEGYKKAVGEEFDKTIPSIFTDEAQYKVAKGLGFAEDKSDIILPWTWNFADTFSKVYGEDINDKIPEIIWDLPNNEPNRIRYCYIDHVCERFVSGFADNCGKWCSENGIYLTGHVLEEVSLSSQTSAVGEAMRSYRSFGMPGIDMLCDSTEFSTAKQAQSASHQYGKEGVMSELYGVTSWLFDFRGHKFQGDWQAALGITLRVPHLSWVSMKGSAKRDYPASISYQSPWYKKYPYIEDHFARVNTALTRGKPIVKVGVIHPIETYWLHYGPAENTYDIRTQLENNFTNVINWLLFGQIDFDFISESLLKDQYCGTDGGFNVGQMKYDAVVVPGCETLRKSTLDALSEFEKAGGKIIFMGSAPRLIDAKKSSGGKELFDKCISIGFSKTELLASLKDERCIDIINSNGNRADNLIYTMREDTDGKWLFIAHAVKNPNKDITPAQNIRLSIKGRFKPMFYNTLDGTITEPDFEIKGNSTVMNFEIYDNDSILLKLLPEKEERRSCGEYDGEPISEIDIKAKVKYSRKEDNVYVLDMAEYSVDGGKFEPIDEILRIDEKIRKQLNLVCADGTHAQPWVMPEEDPKHFVTLRFNIESEISAENIYLALEEGDNIIFNGETVEKKICGYYVDEAIFRIPLPPLKTGINTLEVTVPISDRLSLENMFILGDFDVNAIGCGAKITKKSDDIAFGSITGQGLAFYGGNVVYETEISTPGGCLEIEVGSYRGSLISVEIDGKDSGNIAYAPYKLCVGHVDEGKHTVKLTLYGNRNNTFGALHLTSVPTLGPYYWYGPNSWYTEGQQWAYEYKLAETGILKSPIFRIYSEE